MGQDVVEYHRYLVAMALQGSISSRLRWFSSPRVNTDLILSLTSTELSNLTHHVSQKEAILVLIFNKGTTMRELLHSCRKTKLTGGIRKVTRYPGAVNTDKRVQPNIVVQ